MRDDGLARNPGDEVLLVSSLDGEGAKAIVTEVSELITGEIEFDVVEGGFGFTLDSLKTNAVIIDQSGTIWKVDTITSQNALQAAIKIQKVYGSGLFPSGEVAISNVTTNYKFPSPATTNSTGITPKQQAEMLNYIIQKIDQQITEGGGGISAGETIFYVIDNDSTYTINVLDTIEFNFDSGIDPTDTLLFQGNTPLTKGDTIKEDTLNERSFKTVHNTSGSIIQKGQWLRYDGANGNSGVFRVALMDISTYPSYALIGVATEEIPVDSFGLAQVYGPLKGINTFAYTDSTILYLSETVPGSITDTVPSAANRVIVASVIKSSSNGSIFIRPDFYANETDPVYSADSASLATKSYADQAEQDAKDYADTNDESINTITFTEAKNDDDANNQGIPIGGFYITSPHNTMGLRSGIIIQRKY